MAGIRSFSLNQLAKAFIKHVKHQMDRKKTWSDLQDAYNMAERMEEVPMMQLTPLSGTAPDEALQVAAIAATEMCLDLSTAVAAILAPTFLAGLIEKQAITKRFGVKVLSILEELDSLYKCNMRRSILGRYPAHPDINEPYILAILLQICEILRVYCSGPALGSADIELQFEPNPQLLPALKCFYMPLLHRMRLYDIQAKLADLWLKHADTLHYYSITAKLGSTKLQRKRKLALITEEVCAVLQAHGIDFVIKTRVKSVYSIWYKTQKLKIDVEQLYDLSAIRIIIRGMEGKALVEEKIACWRVLALLGQLYRPICGVMRDWVSRPKSNHYEALHLSFETYYHGRLEVQVRTERMDFIAEYGDAAHWKYKYH